MLVIGDKAQDVPGLSVDVEAHGEFTLGELHHKVGVPVGWGRGETNMRGLKLDTQAALKHELQIVRIHPVSLKRAKLE